MSQSLPESIALIGITFNQNQMAGLECINCFFHVLNHCLESEATIVERAQTGIQAEPTRCYLPNEYTMPMNIACVKISELQQNRDYKAALAAEVPEPADRSIIKSPGSVQHNKCFM